MNLLNSFNIFRHVGAFPRFLELSAISLGEPINFTKLSQDIGVSLHLIMEYFQILEDCLIADRIEPLTESTTRRKLTKAPKYLFFDLGIRRICAKEGQALSQKTMASLFEQFVVPRARKISTRVMALPWQTLTDLCSLFS